MKKKKRNQPINKKGLVKTVMGLNPQQTLLIDKLAEEKALKMFEGMEEYIFSTFKTVMRKNRISEERADRIIKNVKEEVIK